MSDVTKPRPASATPQAAQQKPKAATVCRAATPEETRAWLGRGWIVPVPRPQASPKEKSTTQADKVTEPKP